MIQSSPPQFLGLKLHAESLKVDFTILLRISNSSQDSMLLNCQRQVEGVDCFLELRNGYLRTPWIQGIIVWLETVKERNLPFYKYLSDFIDQRLLSLSLLRISFVHVQSLLFIFSSLDVLSESRDLILEHVILFLLSLVVIIFFPHVLDHWLKWLDEIVILNQVILGVDLLMVLSRASTSSAALNWVNSY